MTRTGHPLRLALPILVLLAALLAGCSEDDSPTAPGTTDPPATAEALMANFVAAYGNMDPSDYFALLTDDFRMRLNEVTVQEFSLAVNEFDRTAEEQISLNMFRGEPHQMIGGGTAAAIDEIDFVVFDQRGEWAVAGPTKFMPGLVFAGFDVSILVFRPEAASMVVEGVVEFYVTSEEVSVGGEVRDSWLIAGMADYTGLVRKSNESTAWGSVKAIYR